MAGKIPKEAIDEIFRRVDILDVVSDYVSLKKRGANYWGLSPFKQERTPSFSVSPAKGIYKCFSTGKGGNAVGFLMEVEGLTYPDALRLLAKRYGIPIAETESDESRVVRDKRESMFVLNNFAAKWFASQLNDTAKSYFAGRGIDEETIREFGLGYNPEAWTSFTDAAIKAKFSPVLLLETGLSAKSEKTGNLYDRFRGRVMFPIHDVMGRVAGFAGRVLSADPQVAKYVNSPESEAYHKGKLLYGLHLAKSHVRAKGECYLVEGYTDVISLYMAGVKNVCAGAGTALTPDQAALLKRFTETVTVLYDGDAAGVGAALRGVDVLLAQGLTVYVLQLPAEHDPDSFVRQNGAPAFIEYAARHRTDFISFKIRALSKGKLQDPAEKSRVVRDVAASVARIPDDLRRNLYLKPCADALRIEETLFASAVREEGLRIQREEKLAKERERRLGSTLPGMAPPPVKRIPQVTDAMPPDFPPETGFSDALPPDFPPETGFTDALPPDFPPETGFSDALPPDFPPETGFSDALPPDFPPDAGYPDALPPDFPPDAGYPDAMPPDFPPETGFSDAMPPDFSPDAGYPDALPPEPRHSTTTQAPAANVIGGSSAKFFQERELLRIFLNHYDKTFNIEGGAVSVANYMSDKIGDYVFETAVYERLKKWLCDSVVQGEKPPLDELLSGRLDDPEAEILRNVAAELLTPPESLSENWRKHDVYLKEFDADLAMTVVQSLHHYDLHYFNGLLKQNLDEFRAASQESELSDEQFDRMLKRHNKILETRKVIADMLGVVIVG